MNFWEFWREWRKNFFANKHVQKLIGYSITGLIFLLIALLEYGCDLNY